MQHKILEKYPDANVNIYAIWFDMFPGDARDKWKPTLLSDNRVMHFWDEGRIAGQWFAKNVRGRDGISWDIYFLYGPDANWQTIPSPLISSGSTVIGKRRQLERDILPLLDSK